MQSAEFCNIIHSRCQLLNQMLYLQAMYSFKWSWPVSMWDAGPEETPSSFIITTSLFHNIYLGKGTTRVSDIMWLYKVPVFDMEVKGWNLQVLGFLSICLKRTLSFGPFHEWQHSCHLTPYKYIPFHFEEVVLPLIYNKIWLH